MARLIVSDSPREGLEGLDPRKVREIKKQVVMAGAQVVQAELKSTIEARHHVVTGDMRDSVGPGKLHEDIDATWVEVYPQGVDRRGVSNMTKLKVITTGFYSKRTGKRRKKSDDFVSKMQKTLEPKVRAEMDKTFTALMSELTK